MRSDQKWWLGWPDREWWYQFGLVGLIAYFMLAIGLVFAGRWGWALMELVCGAICTVIFLRERRHRARR